MKHSRLVLTQLSLAVLLVVFASAAEPPRASSPKDDKSAVVATTLDYIEGYYSGDAARMERSLHPECVKHTVSQFSGKEERLSVKSGLSMVQAARFGEGLSIPKADQREQISVLDVSQNTAAVKLVAAHWTDYLNLVKWNGEWKIVSVLLAEGD